MTGLERPAHDGECATCRLCGDATSRFWFNAKGYRIGRCTRCGFAQAMDVPSPQQLDLLYETLHTKHLKYRSTESTELENRRRLDFIAGYLPPGSTILDAGCATGDFIAVAAERYLTHGVDVSKAAIEQAQARFPTIKRKLKAQRLEDLDGSWSGFDAICLWDVIEHLADPLPVIREMIQRVRPGGYIFLSTPDIGALAARLMRAHWAFMIPPLHLGFFSRLSFEYLFSTAAPAELIAYETRGKTVALAFLLYKLNQMSPVIAPQALVDRVAGRPLGKLNLPIPTNDIAYLCVRTNSPGAALPERR